MFVFPRNSTATFELPGAAGQGWPGEVGRPPCHPLFGYGKGTSFMKLVQPKATWARSLRVKVKVEVNAFEDVLQMKQEGRVGRNPSIFVYFSQHKDVREKISNATT